MANPGSATPPIKTSAILTKPPPSVKIVPRTYTEEEQEKIAELREVDGGFWFASLRQLRFENSMRTRFDYRRMIHMPLGSPNSWLCVTFELFEMLLSDERTGSGMCGALYESRKVEA